MRRQSKDMLFVSVILLELLFGPSVRALPQGAPETICDTMLPQHSGIPVQGSVAPYRIETSSAILGQGQTMRVDIVGVPGGLNFGGFMIQARNRNPPYEIVGQFNPSLDGRARLMNCENSVNNSATHVNPGPKPDVTLEWQSPVDFLGEVFFNATVAQSYDSFWVGIPSKPVKIVPREAAPPPSNNPASNRPSFVNSRPPYVPVAPAAAPAAKVEDPFYDDCGKSKTCFGMPDGCLNSQSCKTVSAVKVRGDIYEFEIKTTTKGAAYVAVGLSADKRMGDDLVIECVNENGRVNMYSSYTSGNPSYGVTREGVPQNTARLLESSIINGDIYCKVERDPVTKVKGQTFDLINNPYFLLVAAGSSVKENGAGYHDLGRLPASKAIHLSLVQELSGAPAILVRLHGAFMIIAWIGTTSLGILLARYFKQTWVGSQLFGKDQWFAWHRICMVTTWTLTVVAFILIFVELGSWSAENNPHAILGLITTILCFIQPFGALFRPAPTSKNRPYFNWGHWLGGNLAHLLAIVTIFFSVKLAKAELPEWMDWILVGYVVFHVIVHIIYSIVGCSADRKQSQRVNTFQMGDMGHHHHHGMRNGMKMDAKMDAPFAGFRKGLLAIYIIVLLCFVVALVLVVVLAPIEETLKSVQSKLMD